MSRFLAAVILIALFASACTIQKRQYRDGWYINRHSGEQQQEVNYSESTDNPDCDGTASAVNPTAVSEVTPDTLTRLQDSTDQRDTATLVGPPSPDDPKPTMTFREAKASLAAKGIPMDPFLEVGYYASLMLIVGSIILLPVSILLLIIALIKRSDYRQADTPGSEEHAAIASRMIQNLLLGFLVLVLFYLAVVVLLFTL